MKAFSLTMILLAGLNAFAAPAKILNCRIEVGGTKYDYLKVAYTANKIVTDLKIQDYELIKNGSQLKDAEVGRSVYGISISPLTQNDDGTLQIQIGLHDYSAVASWKLVLSEDTLEIGVISTYRSSDGDDRLHVTAQSLKCE